MKYLSHDDPEAFAGLVKREPTDHRQCECLKCKGHGGWILRSNAYGEGRHFMAHCPDCDGYGYNYTPQLCVHNWGTEKTVGKCLHEWTCLECGAVKMVDSSD